MSKVPIQQIPIPRDCGLVWGKGHLNFFFLISLCTSIIHYFDYFIINTFLLGFIYIMHKTLYAFIFKNVILSMTIISGE